MKEHDESYYAYKGIKENPIMLDFTGIKHWEIHPMLKEKFGFPEYYGENWDALWDCMRGLFLYKGKYKVEIYGFFSLDKEIKDYCKPMFEVFDDVHKETPNVTFEIIS